MTTMKACARPSCSVTTTSRWCPGPDGSTSLCRRCNKLYMQKRLAIHVDPESLDQSISPSPNSVPHRILFFRRRPNSHAYEHKESIVAPLQTSVSNFEGGAGWGKCLKCHSPDLNGWGPDGIGTLCRECGDLYERGEVSVWVYRGGLVSVIEGIGGVLAKVVGFLSTERGERNLDKPVVERVQGGWGGFEEEEVLEGGKLDEDEEAHAKNDKRLSHAADVNHADGDVNHTRGVLKNRLAAEGHGNGDVARGRGAVKRGEGDVKPDAENLSKKRKRSGGSGGNVECGDEMKNMGRFGQDIVKKKRRRGPSLAWPVEASVQHVNGKARIRIPFGVGWTELYKGCCESVGVGISQGFLLKYKDEDGDWVTVMGEGDLKEMWIVVGNGVEFKVEERNRTYDVK